MHQLLHGEAVPLNITAAMLKVKGKEFEDHIGQKMPDLDDEDDAWVVEPEDPLPPAATAGGPEPTEPTEPTVHEPAMPEQKGKADKDETKSEDDKKSDVEDDISSIEQEDPGQKGQATRLREADAEGPPAAMPLGARPDEGPLSKKSRPTTKSGTKRRRTRTSSRTA